MNPRLPPGRSDDSTNKYKSESGIQSFQILPLSAVVAQISIKSKGKKSNLMFE